jgi:hypothetical protein
MTEERFAELTVNLWRAYQRAVAEPLNETNELYHISTGIYCELAAHVCDLRNAAKKVAA